MKLRRSLSFAGPIAFAVALVGCESSQVSSGPTPVKCEVSVPASSISMEAAGGAGTVAVTTNPECTWTASAADVSWISQVSPASGQGSASVSFHVAANTLTAARQGDLVVNGS